MTNHECHIALWERLGETGGWNKVEVIEELGLPRSRMECYACDEAKHNCRKCPISPIDWRVNFNYCVDPDPTYPCLTQGNLYVAWSNESNIETRKILAKQIAHLPWRER